VEKGKSFLERALELHARFKGKIEVMPKVPILEHKYFAIWYTPGVAEPARVISRGEEKVFDYTSKWNSVAVISDGSRVLGLGDVGPSAALPVMEGKALLFKVLGGVDAFPIVLNTKDPDEIVNVVKAISPTFGGINLEDISTPKCYYVYEQLSKQLTIPVFHDDRFGTAVVVLAGLMNALKIVGKKLSNVRITVVGAGAAGLAVADLLLHAGADPRKMLLVDSKGILYEGREHLDEWKTKYASITNPLKVKGGIAEALKDVDVAIALSRPGPGVITGNMVRSMASDPIVFALANPVPEILPEEAKEAGARIVATGRSDFPNQINNALGFPAIFRGMLDVRARYIDYDMMIAAANEIAKVAEEKGLEEDYIIPRIDEIELYPREAAAVAEAACRSGVARLKVSYSEELEVATSIISRTHKLLKVLSKYLTKMTPESPLF